jgi:hypothetical protein
VEVRLVGEHGYRGGAAALVGADHVGDVSVGPDRSGRGRAALELGDEREPGLDQGLLKGR